jgi:predicted O-methyltransferase YrrM
VQFENANTQPPIDEKNWRFAESFSPEPEPCRVARDRATEMKNLIVSPSTGSALQFLINLAKAKNVVEVGTGTAGASFWIASALNRDDQFTTIDGEGEHYKHAKEILDDFDQSPRVRAIHGKPLEVLPRLADETYDIVVLSDIQEQISEVLEEAIRMVPIGGLLILLNALGNQKVGDLTQRDLPTVNRRLAVQAAFKDNRLKCNLLTIGDGLLVMQVIEREYRAIESSTI